LWCWALEFGIGDCQLRISRVFFDIATQWQIEDEHWHGVDAGLEWLESSHSSSRTVVPNQRLLMALQIRAGQKLNRA
jgi:hypothetical protein